MKKEQMILTYPQAKELKFFCQNVVGVSQDFYDVRSTVAKFDERIHRLEKTCGLIEKYLGEQIKSFDEEKTVEVNQ